jgi:RNA polymerase sigma-70 factor (TIGR02960 family)
VSEMVTGRDEAVFAELFAAHRRELHRHCYRMLGSVTDADDLVQETMIAAWRGWADFAGRSSARAWLYRIATNRCLNAIRDGKRRPGPALVPPFAPPEPSRWGEVTWLQPYPDAWLPGPAEQYEARESIELAFIAAVQRIPARQTAAVVLCDVLGFSGAEVAAMLDITATSVKGLLQRGRAALAAAGAEVAGEVGGVGGVGGVGLAGERELAERFARAFSADDVPAVVALLTDDAWLAMPPAPHEYHGPAAIAAFLLASVDARAGGSGQRFALRAARFNGQPGFWCRLGSYDAGVVVLTLRGDRIGGVTRFLDPALPARLRMGP